MTKANFSPRLIAIVALSSNRAIGRDNQLLWHLPNDLQFFKRITLGHTVIMGRKTFESIGKPLPNRRNIVISRQKGYSSNGIEVAHSLEHAIELCQGEEEVFIIGGAEIYRQSLPYVDTIYQTRVDVEINGDAFFPELMEQEWELKILETHTPDDRHCYSYQFIQLDRIIFK